MQNSVHQNIPLSNMPLMHRQKGYTVTLYKRTLKAQQCDHSWLQFRVKFLRPTRPTGDFRDVLCSQSLGIVVKKLHLKLHRVS